MFLFILIIPLFWLGNVFSNETIGCRVARHGGPEWCAVSSVKSGGNAMGKVKWPGEVKG